MEKFIIQVFFGSDPDNESKPFDEWISKMKHYGKLNQTLKKHFTNLEKLMKNWQTNHSNSIVHSNILILIMLLFLKQNIQNV